MRNYEIMFIVNPTTTEEEIDKINTQIGGVITAGGGTIEKTEKQGKRKLAYPVSKFREGYYVLFSILADGAIIKEAERRLRVMDPVIKYITVRMNEEIRRLDKIKAHRQKRAAKRSAHAKAGPVEQSAEEF